MPTCVIHYIHEARTGGSSWDSREAVKLRNKVGQTALHSAAIAGSWGAASLLHSACPDIISWQDKRDLSAAAYASKRGHTVRLSYHNIIYECAHYELCN